MRGARRWLFPLLVLATVANELMAMGPGPRPGGRGFRLFARSEHVLAVNRVSCALRASGELCFPPILAFGFGGGFWPRGSPNLYVFDSGFLVAGIVGGTKADNPWATDTTGAFFFGLGGGSNGEQVQPIYDATDPDDLANWPEAALVPSGDATEALFHPILRGTPSASQGDAWWLTWEGNPSIGQERRRHPLGVLLEQRAMAWNAPAGNEDIIYFLFTIYNITSTRSADYVGVRPAMREIVLQKAREFQVRNNAAFGITLPERGYPITDIFLAFAADMDVGNSDLNYASVNVPFGLGYTYQRDFGQPENWVFDPAVFSPPFFEGAGFVGVKYLSSPRDSLGQPVGLTLFGTLYNQGFPGLDLVYDPADAIQLYRYVSADLDPAKGDGHCNTGDPKATHICFINHADPIDVRFFQSSGPFTLPPGGFQSVAVAYIFAAPVATVDCSVECDVRPGDPTILGDAAKMAAGVNAIDSVAGYQGFTDANGDGRVDQSEFGTVPRSLLGKALVAQSVFDSGFLVPFGPDPTEFFLVPGDNQVTVLWRPSATETEGDPFFVQASAPTVIPPGGGAPMPNPQYDPNYRQYDVEGYRIYRGRVESPTRLHLVAQFDYAGTVIRDFTGTVNPSPDCAPELGIDHGCPVPFDSLLPGVAPTTFVDVPLIGEITQAKRGDRVALATGNALILSPDTAITGAGSGCVRSGDPEECRLRDTGVPFAFVDRGVRNDLRYFYSVTAFDLNSFSSTPSSLESPRITKSVTPSRRASNFENSAVVRLTLAGRGTNLDSAGAVPALDPGTGRFSGPFPPANDLELGLTEVVKEVLAEPASFSVRLDSLRLGIPSIYSLTATIQEKTLLLQVPVSQDVGTAPSGGVADFDAVSVAEDLARRYGGRGGYALQARLRLALQGNEFTNAWGRGCFKRSDGFAASGTTGCEYNGPRWFDGPSPARNETKAHPQAAHPSVAETPAPMPDLNNAGELTGVATIQMPHAYLTTDAPYERIERILGSAQRAADFNLYWGDDGRIDSVVDATHNVQVPFDSLGLAGSWGVLNRDATVKGGAFDERPDVLTAMDFTCVEPLRSEPSVQSSFPCKTSAAYRLSRTARPAPIVIWDQKTANAQVIPPRPGQGFALYLAGNITIFELQAGLPDRGAVWTLRTYVGAISGGSGAAGDEGPYTFSSRPRPFTAVGAELRVSYEVVNRVVAATRSDLSRVHTVPDPYYVMSKYEATTFNKVLKFVNLPERAIIRIYSSSGILVALLEHQSGTHGGSADWNLRNRNEQVVASGVYFYHIESGDARKVGRFTVVNFAE
jgi:hypothetical protein